MQEHSAKMQVHILILVFFIRPVISSILSSAMHTVEELSKKEYPAHFVKIDNKILHTTSIFVILPK